MFILQIDSRACRPAETQFHVVAEITGFSHFCRNTHASLASVQEQLSRGRMSSICTTFSLQFGPSWWHGPSEWAQKLVMRSDFLALYPCSTWRVQVSGVQVYSDDSIEAVASIEQSSCICLYQIKGPKVAGVATDEGTRPQKRLKSIQAVGKSLHLY